MSIKPIFFAACLLTGLNLLTAQSAIFWINTDEGLETSAIDGSNRKVLFSKSETIAQGITLDRTNGFIYWTDWVANKVYRARQDGSDLTELISGGLDQPEGIALDLQREKMYWVDSGSKKVQRANLDGSNIEDLVIYERVNLDGITLDVANGQMYWTEWGDGAAVGKVKRADLDGTNVKTLVRLENALLKGIDLDLDRRHIYWTDCSQRRIQRSTLDGKDITDILTVTDGLATPNALRLDLDNGKIYWSDVGTFKIRRANLDGSNVEDVIADNMRTPQDLVLRICDDIGERPARSASDCFTTTSTSASTPTPLTIYPNPAQTALTIKGLAPDQPIQLFNAFGQLILTQKVRQPSLQLDIQDLPNGIYYLLSTQDTQAFSGQFIKNAP